MSRPREDSGDGGLFAALGGGALCVLALAGIVALVGWGTGAGRTTLEIGLLVIVAGVVTVARLLGRSR